MAEQNLSGLLLTLQNPEQIKDPVVRAELEQAFAAIQTWVARSGFANVPRNVSIGGSLSILQQPACRMFIASSSQVFPDLAETPIIWGIPTAEDNLVGIGIYDPLGMFDGVSTVYLTDPGTYLIQSRVRWDSNTGGSSRILQIRLDLDDLDGDVAVDTPVAALTQHVHAVVRFTPTYRDRYNKPRGLPVIIEASHNSGGDRTLSSLSWCSVTKLS